MTLSSVERKELDRIEISLLASDPALATTLDMTAVRRRLVRRGRVARRGQRLGLAIGLAGLGAGAAGGQPLIGTLVALGGAVLCGGAARTAQRVAAALPAGGPVREDSRGAHTAAVDRLSGA